MTKKNNKNNLITQATIMSSKEPVEEYEIIVKTGIYSVFNYV